MVLRYVWRCLDEECPIHGLRLVFVAHLLRDLVPATVFLRGNQICVGGRTAGEECEDKEADTALSRMVPNDVYHLRDARQHDVGADHRCLSNESRDDNTAEMRNHRDIFPIFYIPSLADVAGRLRRFRRYRQFSKRDKPR